MEVEKDGNSEGGVDSIDTLGMPRGRENEEAEAMQESGEEGLVVAMEEEEEDGGTRHGADKEDSEEAEDEGAERESGGEERGEEGEKGEKGGRGGRRNTTWGRQRGLGRG
eukprot:TRINITY_DN12920_c2_g1_i1.p3 TRINITY_DN12920_c2_g1~~TRINITY_DN12920_c2_g1_i1.p3  ORF type:complete len:110 (+),score=29.63 TRINITY_DN12920_c2_g1_i1:36-365(+)